MEIEKPHSDRHLDPSSTTPKRAGHVNRPVPLRLNTFSRDSKAASSVTIIGAGPYGISTAAYLQFFGFSPRIFGTPMRRWLSQMPKSMLLKSEACASNLPDPQGHYTLARYCQEKGIPHFDYKVPLSREHFSGYALWFQQALVPQVEDVLVTAVVKDPSGFEIRLENGKTLRSANLIIATGLDQMAYRPIELSGLPRELCSHSADHYDLSKLKGKEVAVIGGGQSGLETAAILKESGASVTLIVRDPTLAWNRVPSTNHRSAYQRLRRPRSRLGEGLKTWAYDRAPLLFHWLPLQTRVSIVKTTLGPSGAWWLKERVVEKIPILLGHRICAAEVRNGRLALAISDQQNRQELVVDHVIASTGYRFDLQKLPFFSRELQIQIAQYEGAPRLSSNFESSVPGLYFTGLASAHSFGPLMRFLAGTDFTARTIATHLTHRHGRPRSFAAAHTCIEK